MSSIDDVKIIAMSNPSNDLPKDSDKKHNLLYLRPNNYAIYCSIISDDSSIRLPMTKKAGKGERQYWYRGKSTIERTGKSIICYARKTFNFKIDNPGDVDQAHKKVVDFLISELQDFQNTYPTITIDLCNAKIIRKEIELKEHKLNQIPKQMKVHDTVGKKVYDKGFEFYNEGYVKQYIKNRSIEDWSPELLKEIELMRKGFWDELNFLKEQIAEHRALIQDYRKESLLHRQLFENMKPKESFFSKMKRWFR